MNITEESTNHYNYPEQKHKNKFLTYKESLEQKELLKQTITNLFNNSDPYIFARALEDLKFNKHE